MAPERLQKVLAAAGVASRRGSEALIAAGRVTVDGRPATIGQQVDPATALVEVDGRPIAGSVAHAYLALHKPAGVTSTVRDRHAERTVLDLVPATLVPERALLYPVGRLDRDSEGLLLLTNDGEWAERVLHPRFGVDREYAVALGAPLTAAQVESLSAGIDLDEGRATLAGPLRPLSPTERGRFSELLSPPPDPGLTWYRATLRQGWKRQLRRMFGAVGAPVARLVRVRIGTVRLDVASGGVRRLRPPEVNGIASTPGSATGRRPRGRPSGGRRPGAGSRR